MTWPSLEDDLRLVVQSLDVAIWSFDVHSRRVELSNSWKTLLGFEADDMGDDFDRWYGRVHPEDRPEVKSIVNAQGSVGAEPRFEFEHRVLDAHGEYRWLLVRGKTLRDEQGEPQRVIGIAIDLTQLKALAGVLHESDARFRMIADSAPALIWISGTHPPGTPQHKRCTWFNRQWLEFTGRTMEQELGFGWTQGLHPDDLGRSVHAYAAAFNHRAPFEMECRLRHHSGEYRWLLDRGIPRYDGEGGFAGYVGSCADITEKKQTLSLLCEREKLLRQLLELNERERKLMACEIHDGLLQDIIGVDMLLQSCENLSGAEMENTLRTARDTLRVAISQGRRLIGELRPMILDEQGIVGGIEYLIAEMDGRIKAQLELTSDLTLDYRSSIWGGNLFRIVQEALTNVERHSKATLAKVDLTQRGDKLAVEIADNGIGFDLDKVPDDRFGLRSIRERANIFGGSAQIKSTPGRGTKIIVEIPLPKGAQPEPA